ncbi:hypothetical protein DET60_102201 [Raoultella planticola]|uniref:hypothetical protein n=1 Tax=Raoultella planticola TaxID=575 RepID=UPI0010630294|nr:hypothetical protein [Raoultella planticola]TDV08899.1 hypothetical protein DFO76_103481 [Raoultella planticola]TDX39828.1 hypothetical protein DET60_102201 [Raoultella planticola]
MTDFRLFIHASTRAICPRFFLQPIVASTKLAFLITLAMASLDVLAAPSGQSVITYPTQHCHALQRPLQQAVADALGPAYAGIQKQVRWDIVCIGDVVRVTTPIRSNGGDIIIFANRLELSAPIDSRVYISPDDYSPYLEKSDTYSGASELTIAKQGSDLRKIYDDYYRRSPDKVVSSEGKIFLPENPAGLTGQEYWSCESPDSSSLKAMVPATSPPLLTEKSNINPGIIKVFANTFTFDDAALAAYPLFDGDPLSCNTSPLFTKGKVFIARGMRGGRGGAGATTAAFYPKFPCVDSAYRRSGFLNAAGGSGGSGGHVRLVIVGSTVNNIDAELESRIAIDGGPPGSAQRIRAPAWIGPDAASSSDVCGLKSEGKWPIASVGASGIREVIRQTPTDALLEFFGDIASRDARPDYNFDELIGRSKVPSEGIKGFTYASFAERKFYEILISTEITWVDKLNGLINTSVEAQSPVLGGVWAPIDLTRLNESVMTNEAVQPLRYLSSFSPILGVGPIKGYFLNTGGMFNLRSTSAVVQWDNLASRTEATLSAAKLAQIQGTLSQISESVADIREVVRSNEFRYQLSVIQERLKTVQAAADKAKATHSIESTEKALQEAGQGVAMLFGAYDSGNLSMAGAGIIKLKEGIDDLSDSTASPPTFDAQIAALNSAISDTSNQFNNFLEYSAQSKSRILSEQRQDLIDYFETNSSYGARLQARSTLFHDLLRTILIGYFQDPNKNSAELELRTNLVGLYTLLRDYPSREPSFSFRDIQLGCNSQKDGEDQCLIIEPSNSSVSLTSKSSDWTKGLPLYVISPRATKITLPSFGASWVSEPLGDAISPAMPLGNLVPNALLEAPSNLEIR